MRIVIFTLTKGAMEQGLRIKEYLSEAILYTKPEFTVGQDSPHTNKTTPMVGSLKEVVEKEFGGADLLIFIMATGIVVRMIAPHLQHKGKDPAVLVMDEEGRNIISLLSGHLGGANEWTSKLSDLLGANPVITTASDVRGVLSVDLFAEENNLGFEDWEGAKKITAHLVNGGTVGVYGELTVKELPKGYRLVDCIEELLEYDCGILIGGGKNTPIDANESTNKNLILQLYPKNLVVGIGCKKDTPTRHILEEIQQTFHELKLSTSSVVKFTTVDVKEDEVGLREAAKFLRVPLEIIDRQPIKEIEEQFETSEFVRKTIGVGAVSGPCAYLGSNRGRLILEKRRNRGITLSIAEMNKG